MHRAIEHVSCQNAPCSHQVAQHGTALVVLSCGAADIIVYSMLSLYQFYGLPVETLVCLIQREGLNATQAHGPGGASQRGPRGRPHPGHVPHPQPGVPGAQRRAPPRRAAPPPSSSSSSSRSPRRLRTFGAPPASGEDPVQENIF